MKVSIIVPVYNTEKYLRKCLDSLLNQTLRDIEIICINDASPDNSLAILREYEAKDSRIVVVNLKENLRQGGARNCGIKLAKAEYIGFVDSDDWVAEEMYEKLYNKAISEDADIVNCDYYEYRSREDIRMVVKYPDDAFRLPREQGNKHFILKIPAPWHNLYRKKLFLNHLFFPEHIFYEDAAIMSVIFLLAGKIVKVNKALCYYRLDNLFSTCRKNDDLRYFERIRAMDMFIENMKTYGFYGKYKDEIEYQYIKVAWHDVILGSLFKFNSIPVQELTKAKKNISGYFAGYRQNKYYKSEPLTVKKIIFLMMDFNLTSGIYAARFARFCYYLKRRFL